MKNEEQLISEYYSRGGHDIKVHNIDNFLDGKKILGKMTGTIAIASNIADFTHDGNSLYDQLSGEDLDKPSLAKLSSSLRFYKSRLERKSELVQILLDDIKERIK